MSFSSLMFILVFMPLGIAVNLVIPKKFSRTRNVLLTVISLLLYSLGEPLHVLLLLICILFNHRIARSVEKRRSGGKKRNSALWLGVTVNVLILVLFKVLNSCTGIIKPLLSNADFADYFILPVGLSFYVFSAISLLADVASGKAASPKKLTDTALYLAFFIKIVSGPLVKYSDFEKQLGERRVTFDGFSQGMMRFAVGLGKKIIIASNLSSVSALTFDSSKEIPVLLAWLGVLAYFLEVFFDFSGYSDMAVGLGKMLGFDIPENFDYPYMSSSVAEYWRRWHITLGAWFRSYVFYPVSVSKPCLKINRSCRKRFGSSVGRIVAVALPLLAVWVLTGLWHNLSGRYLLWGLLNGLFIIWETARKPMKNKRAEKAFGHFYTVALAFFTKILVRSKSIAASCSYFLMMLGVGADGIADARVVGCLREYWIYFVFGIAFCFPLSRLLREKIEKSGKRVVLEIFNYAAAICAGFILVVSVAMMLKSGESPFIYGNF